MSPTELVLPVRQHHVLRHRANAHDLGRGSTATFLVGSGSSSGCIEDNAKGSRGVGWGVDVRKDGGKQQMGRMHVTDPRGSVHDSKLIAKSALRRTGGPVAPE